MIRINDQEFNELVRYIKEQYGINLEKKRVLIEGRLATVLQEKNCQTFTDYINLLKRDKSGSEVTTLLNKITTNHTYFMREPKHFEYMKNTVLPEFEKTHRTKAFHIWSAGCSVGAEAYTALMTIHDYLGAKDAGWNIRVTATDISESVLSKGRSGIYSEDMIKDVSAAWRSKYFQPAAAGEYQIVDKLRREITFKTLNLMGNFSFVNKFQLIFCRNVMIYFDQETRRKLIDKFYDVLEPGGYFFIGHSETIARDTSRFQYVMPAIYKKV